MAIDAYTGRPRSGKSYSVVKNVILPSLRGGRHVFTNIPLTEVAHEEFPGLIHQLDAKWYSDPNLVDQFFDGAVVVLDELWRRWPKGMHASKVPFKDKEFLAEHGHLVDDEGNTTRVVLVTQDLDQIAAFATMLVDVTYMSVKLSAVGASSKFRVDIYEGAAKGQRPPKAQLLRSTYDTYDKKYYRYYKSATKSKTGEVGDESRADKRASIWRSPLMLFTLAAPVILGLLVWQIGEFFANGMSFDSPEPEPVVAAVVAEPESEPMQLSNPWPSDLAPAAEPAAPSAEPRKRGYSAVWRVAGHMQRVDPDSKKMRDVVMLASLAGVRYEPLEQCEKISMGYQYQCEIDGDLVTPWSGPINQNMAGYVLGGASESINMGRQAVGLGAERSAGTEGRTAQPNIQPSI